MSFLAKFRSARSPLAKQEEKKHACTPAREGVSHATPGCDAAVVSHATLTALASPERSTGWRLGSVTTADHMAAAPCRPEKKCKEICTVSHATPEKFRQIRDQRWEFCRECSILMMTERLTEPNAAAAVIARSPGRWPLINPSYHNFRRWAAAMGKKDGKINFDNIDALLPGYRTGAKKVEDLFDPRVMRIFLAMYLSPRRPTFASCYRETKTLFAREYPDIIFPTEAQIRYQLQRIPAPVIEAGRVGLDYAVNHSLYMLIRDWDKIRPNQVWFADSRTFDQLMKVPAANKENSWTGVRPNVTYFMDAASWYCVGYDVTGEGVDNNLIRNVFAKACLTHGRPEVLYIDNGKDYNKAGFTVPVNVLGKEYSILQSLDVKLTNALPYRGRSKTVERSFRDFSMDFDRRQPSYLGDSPANRPDGAELYDTPEGVQLLPTLGEFVAMLDAEVEMYNSTPRGGRWHGKSPREVFQSPHRVTRPELDPEAMRLALLLPLPSPRQVFRGGCVSIDKVQYYARELFQYIDKKVVIKSSYLEPGRVHAFTQDGSYIAECVAQTTTHPLANLYGDDNDKAALAGQLLEAGQQYKALKNQLQSSTMGLAGLAIEDIKSLSRAELESGEASVTVLVKRKVKAGNHVLPLQTVPGKMARTGGVSEPAVCTTLRRPAEDEALLAEADRLLLAATQDKSLDDDVSADELAAVQHIITKRKDEDDEF